MATGEKLQSVCGGSDSGGVITYKRRRRDGGDSGGTQSGGSEAEIQMLRHDNFLRNGVIRPDMLSRISNNWRQLLESLAEVKDMGDDGGATFCIQKALACDPCRFFIQTKNGSVQTEESFRENGKINFDTEGCFIRRSSRSSRGKSEIGLNGNIDPGDQASVNTVNCRNALCDILTSGKFALLCDLLGENFKSNPPGIFDLTMVFSKMRKGIYDQSTDMFDKDMQLIWEKFLRIGQEMVLLASSLLSISRASYQRQVGKMPASTTIVDDQNNVLNEIFDSMQLTSGCVTNQQSTKESVRGANYVESYTTAFTSLESDPFPKAEPTDPSCVQKISTCYCCGMEVDGNTSLICDGCEAVHHVSCIKSNVHEIPGQTWYCASCSANRGESVLPTLTCAQQGRPHLDCVVCKRISDLGPGGKAGQNPEKILVPSSSRECSVSSMEGDESPEPSRTALMHLCKQCGTCEDEDKRFLVCSNKYCLFKYYHIRCLKSTQLASKHQPPDRWYCPSCLCRGCLEDKDDDLICLCDTCDEGYHIYCMKPPRSTVPKGSWFCFSCNMEKAKKGMKMFEQSVLQTHGKSNTKHGKRPVDENAGDDATLVTGNKRNR